MHDYQKEFIEFAIHADVLQFGKFTLKSGRQSPYFFNTGLFNTGSTLAELGRYYARSIVNSKIQFDMLFGPAYKGIPLVATTAIALATHHQIDVPWCFNRKEAKDHGEGGTLVGAPLRGRVLVIDDVITAGTAIREAVAIIQGEGARLAAVSIAVDRQERGNGELSAIQEVESYFDTSIISVVSLNDLIDYLRADGDKYSCLRAIENYRAAYGTSDEQQ